MLILPLNWLSAGQPKLDFQPIWNGIVLYWNMSAIMLILLVCIVILVNGTAILPIIWQQRIPSINRSRLWMDFVVMSKLELAARNDIIWLLMNGMFGTELKTLRVSMVMENSLNIWLKKNITLRMH